MSKPLLLQFADEASATTATRDSLKSIADRLGVSETKAAHIAINRLYRDIIQGDADFDVPDEAARRREEEGQDARVVSSRSLLEIVGGG